MIYKGSRTIQWRKEVFSKIGAEAIRYTHAKKWIWTPILQHIQSESHPVVSDSLRPHGLYSPRNSPGQNTGVGGCSLLQRIFPTQGSNPGLAHCRWILYQLSYKGNPCSSQESFSILANHLADGKTTTRIGCGAVTIMLLRPLHRGEASGLDCDLWAHGAQCLSIYI